MSEFPIQFDEENNLKLIDSGADGPTVAVIACVHGNERVGVDVLRHIVEEVRVIRGKVWLIGGNPRAYALNKRFVERDLNRCFGVDGIAYENERAREIVEVLDQCDAVLDIHQSFEPQNFVVCESISVPLACKFDVPYVITSVNDLNVGSTDAYMESKGKIGICLESGGMNDADQVENEEYAFGGVVRFLFTMGNIREVKPSESTELPRVLQAYSEYQTRARFVPVEGLSMFDQLAVGQVIGTDGGERVLCPSEWEGHRILFLHKEEAGKPAFGVARVVGD